MRIDLDSHLRCQHPTVARRMRSSVSATCDGNRIRATRAGLAKLWNAVSLSLWFSPALLLSLSPSSRSLLGFSSSPFAHSLSAAFLLPFSTLSLCGFSPPVPFDLTIPSSISPQPSLPLLFPSLYSSLLKKKMVAMPLHSHPLHFSPSHSFSPLFSHSL